MLLAYQGLVTKQTGFCVVPVLCGPLFGQLDMLQGRKETSTRMSTLSLLRRKKHQDVQIEETSVSAVTELVLTENGLVDQHGNSIMRDITAEDLQTILGKGINVEDLQHLGMFPLQFYNNLA